MEMLRDVHDNRVGLRQLLGPEKMQPATPRPLLCLHNVIAGMLLKNLASRLRLMRKAGQPCIAIASNTHARLRRDRASKARSFVDLPRSG